MAPNAARRLDRTVGILIIVASFLAAVAISRWARNTSQQDAPEPPGPPTPEGVFGWPDGVDAVKTLPAARQLTRRPILRGFVAEGVRSNGVLDAKSGLGWVRYSFQSPQSRLSRGAPDAALGLPPQCGAQSVVIRAEGLAAEPDNPMGLCPLDGLEPLPDPRCTLEQVWQNALERGAPKESLARIEYYRSRVGPAWRFEVPGTSHRFSLYGDCGRELAAEEAAGHVP